VSAGIERSLTASRAVEGLLADRLIGLARGVGSEVEDSPGREEMILHRFVLRERLKGAVLAAPDFSVLAATGWGPPPELSAGGSPVASSRLQPMVAEDLLRRARRAGLGERDMAVVGFGESPFGTSVEFLVGIRLVRTGNFLLLRQHAETLRGLREDAGVQRLIEASAQSAAISYLLLSGADGRILAASDPSRVGEALPPLEGEIAWREEGDERVLDVSVPATWPGSDGGSLRVGLAEGPVRAVLVRGRRSVFLFTALAVLVGAAGAVGLVILSRSAGKKQGALEKALRRKEQAAVLGRMAGAVAHEVRSPLNAISMAAQRLERGAGEDDPSRPIIESMRREVARMNRTVEDFLDLSRERLLQPGPIDLGELVAEIVAADAPGARIIAAEDGHTVTADREELRRALGNLVRNARQAAGESGVTVAWRKEDRATAIEVRDSGPGVPERERERIFLHFVTHRAGGTGLGLAIARLVAERHGGTLAVDEAPEGGARFTLVLPPGESG
jgi:signal transduction histidine kinase